jgi:hypothetical protein
MFLSIYVDEFHRVFREAAFVRVGTERFVQFAIEEVQQWFQQRLDVIATVVAKLHQEMEEP